MCTQQAGCCAGPSGKPEEDCVFSVIIFSLQSASKWPAGPIVRLRPVPAGTVEYLRPVLFMGLWLLELPTENGDSVCFNIREGVCVVAHRRRWVLWATPAVSTRCFSWGYTRHRLLLYPRPHPTSTLATSESEPSMVFLSSICTCAYVQSIYACT